MRISGFTFVRNGTRHAYPYRESIRSLLPLVDELVVNVGDGDDDTLEQVRALQAADDRIRIVESAWDPALRSGGRILAQQTDIAWEHCTGDWRLYLQADEVLHEADYPALRAALAGAWADPRVEALVFDYVHFYGSCGWRGTGRRWYRREVRALKALPGVHSWQDAQGFRRDGRKLRVAPAGARVFHYGWVRPPEAMRDKKQAFEHWWEGDKAAPVELPDDWDYDPTVRVRPYRGSHPAVMADRIAASSRQYRPRRNLVRWLTAHPAEALSAAVEATTGWRIGEYRNYKLVRRRPPAPGKDPR